MTHPANYTTRDLAASILGMHDRSYEDMLETSTRAINAAIAAAVQAVKDEYAKTLPVTIKTAIEAEREAILKLADDLCFDYGAYSKLTESIRARNEATK